MSVDLLWQNFYHTFAVWDASRVVGGNGVLTLHFVFEASGQGGLAGIVGARAPNALCARKIEGETCRQGSQCSACCAAICRLIVPANTRSASGCTAQH